MMWHWLEHKLGINTGEIVSEWWRGSLWIGFRCSKCGQVSGAHKSYAEAP